jgi:hypothetical protein
VRLVKNGRTGARGGRGLCKTCVRGKAKKEQPGPVSNHPP